MKNLFRGFMAGLLLAMPIGFAQEKESHVVTGAIIKLESKAIEVKTAGGSQTFVIDGKTQFGTKTDAKTASDFKAGDRVVITFGAGGVATGIKIAKPKPAEAPNKN